jgi:UDP-N-acetylglucosamine 2-epimerase (non-hydrolysing)/GDP/UDP-N,N'-diacetylbacillosamine 2-epimerase (hydrolysing)
VAKKRVCVVTGSRAEYGLLQPLLCALKADPAFDLQIVATGMHLAPEFGLTYRVIENDGFKIDAKVEMLLSSDTPVGTIKSLGLAVIGMADALEGLAPALVIVLGDRFEIFAASQAALIMRIPLAHIAGGDTTEGAIDEAMRHSITKMAQLHFATNRDAEKRVVQMGEDPARVFNVGSLGLDAIRLTSLLDRDALQAKLGFDFRSRNLLVTFHPVTLASDFGLSQFDELTTALDRMGDQTGVIFTRPNADPAGRRLIERLDEYAASRSNMQVYTSLGQQLYFSIMAQVDAVVGNSSSGLYEAPSFCRPTVDIGERQRGRLASDSVIHCEPHASAIEEAIRHALTMDCSKTINPYGNGNAADRIMEVLKRELAGEFTLIKKFHSVGNR